MNLNRSAAKRCGVPLCVAMTFAIIHPTAAQMMTPQPGSISRPIELPQSVPPSVAGSTSLEQTTPPQGPNTRNSLVQSGGALQGSIPATDIGAGPLMLTLADAVRLALRTNLGVIASVNSTTAARAQRIQALSALLPNLSANTSESIMQVNLAAYGFSFSLPPGMNFSVPSVVGPFSYFQAQGTVSQSIYDPVARRNWNATKELERAAILSAKDARELVVFAVAAAYLQTVATAARIESQQAQVANAQAIYNQAEVRKAAGTNSRIDVTRTLVELETEKQRLTSFESDYRQQKLALASAIGLPFDRDLNLSDPLASDVMLAPEPATAIELAFRLRSDLRASEAQVSAARQALSAARGERLPSLGLNGDYGISGSNPASVHTVYTGTVNVNVPIWRGGRVKGDIQEAQTTLQQRESELADRRRRVEQDVRAALMMLDTAVGQARVAENNRSYAGDTLRQARDRFNVGVGTTVEVVQAEQQVASAESDYVSSLLSLDLAQLNLAKAKGQAEISFAGLLKGKRP